MDQLASLTAAMRRVASGSNPDAEAAAFLVGLEGQRVGKVKPQARRLRILALWREGMTTARIATALGCTERRVRQIVGKG